MKTFSIAFLITVAASMADAKGSKMISDYANFKDIPKEFFLEKIDLSEQKVYELQKEISFKTLQISKGATFYVKENSLLSIYAENFKLSRSNPADPTFDLELTGTVQFKNRKWAAGIHFELNPDFQLLFLQVPEGGVKDPPDLYEGIPYWSINFYPTTGQPQYIYLDGPWVHHGIKFARETDVKLGSDGKPLWSISQEDGKVLFRCFFGSGAPFEMDVSKQAKMRQGFMRSDAEYHYEECRKRYLKLINEGPGFCDSMKSATESEIRLAVKDGIDPSAPDQIGTPPIFYALHHPNPLVPIRTLIELGVSPNSMRDTRPNQKPQSLLQSVHEHREYSAKKNPADVAKWIELENYLISVGANEKGEERLFKIKKVQILNDREVYLQSDAYTLDRRTKDGGIEDDRHYLQNGQMKDKPNARRHDEITLTVGQSCFVGDKNESSTLTLVKIKNQTATFEQMKYSRVGKESKRIIHVTPY